MDITSIIQHVFKQPSLEGVSLSELEKFAAKQPFFAVGQYLLLRKMKDIRDPGFEKQLQKTRLYFENPLWLQQLLLRKNDLFIPAHAQNEPIKELTENLVEEAVWVNKNEIVDEQPSSSSGIIQFENDEVLEEAPSIDNYQNAIVDKHEIHEKADEEAIAPSIEVMITEEVAPEVDIRNPEVDIQNNVVEPAMRESVKAEIVTIEEAITESLSPDIVENPSPVTTIEAGPATVNIGLDSTDIQEDYQQSEGNEEGKPDFVLPVYTKPAEQIEDALVFQAYHTIDYFASQGIKISHKAEMSDKLGTQLKSFTEWLKTMKRLTPSKLEQQMEDKESEVVVEMAAHSLESKEVLTETMAEVLLKQGKKDSAIEVYNKLSLLNPSKTPYFAAKIEAIKQN